MPKKYEYGPHYDSGQIRIAFLAGNDNLNDVLKVGCIFSDSHKGRTHNIKDIKKQQGWNNEFHIFSINWTPGMLLKVQHHYITHRNYQLHENE